ncbi:MAG: hypothetical protein NTZ64_07005 [Polaromonas sp.]|nr:hypothetical protein [Polaromonas sp.]
MKTKMLILLVVSAASLAGCMVYPRYGHGGYRGDGGPTYIYRDGGDRRDESDHRGEYRRRSDGEHGDRDSGNSRH